MSVLATAAKNHPEIQQSACVLSLSVSVLLAFTPRVAIARQVPRPQDSSNPLCASALPISGDAALVELCLGEEALHAADGSDKNSPERARQLRSAITHYRRSVSLAASDDIKARAIDSLVKIYDSMHLDEPAEVEHALRELIALQPQELAPIFRLAEFQEQRDELEAAEDTLLMARRLQADSVDPYKRLAQFYARRVARMTEAARLSTQIPPSQPGEPDALGVYRVGPGVSQPARVDEPMYPPEAMAAEIEGSVLVEVVIGADGNVADAKVLRSVPLLDEEALRTVRSWRFRPAMTEGKPIPVRMTVTVDFTKKK